jgi:universal stress protein E
MSNRRNVLVIVGFESDARQVVDRAVLIARELECDLDILLCDTNGSAFITGFLMPQEKTVLRDQILQMQEEFVESLAEQARSAGITAIATILDKRPIGDGIMARAFETEPCIVMKGTEFHTSSERAILVDTDWQLMRTCPFPLWLVKSEVFRKNPVVVAAVDPMSEHDKLASLDQKIVRTAKSIVDSLGGEVHLLHTYQRLVGIGSAATRAIKTETLPIDEIDKRIQTEHRKALDQLAADNEVDADSVHQFPGRTRDILPTFVRSRKADLVVMGALARWGIKRMLIGSTAERVLDHLPCDVLIVRDNQNEICPVSELQVK